MANDLAQGLISTIDSVSRILIVIKGSPDPDVLASSFALKALCEWREVDATIVSLMEISLPQNRALIQKLDIPVFFIKRIYSPDDFDGYAVLDHQSAWVDDIDTKIPCLIHIDHHTPESDRIKPKFKYITDKIGAVSTLFAELMHTENPDIELSLKTRIATALFYGIKIDTDDFRLAQDDDIKTAKWLKDQADGQIISDMESIPYSEETITIISKAIMNSYYYKDWLICGVGFIPESHRDSIAIAADYMLKNEDTFAVVVFALIERSNNGGLFLDASIRAIEESFDLNRFIKYIAPEGGARSFKGAFQVHLDFFGITTSKSLLWELIRETTTAHIIKARDHFPIISIETLFSKIRRKLGKMF